MLAARIQPPEAVNQPQVSMIKPPAPEIVLEKETDMEVETLPHPNPPPILSPIFSPKPTKKQISPLNAESLIDLNNCCKEDWPPELLQGNNNDVFTVTTIIQGTEKSSEISLRRTLKRCNLRSIEPSRTQQFREGKFSFELKIRGKSLQNQLLKISNNWIPVDESKINLFQINDQTVEINSYAFWIFPTKSK